jgi:hypothetical protein
MRLQLHYIRSKKKKTHILVKYYINLKIGIIKNVTTQMDLKIEIAPNIFK